MLNKIKDKLMHILREKCGYYELKLNYEELEVCNNNIAKKYEKKAYELFDLDNKIDKLKSILESKNAEYEYLSSQHEAKILEYDILENKFKKLVGIITNEHTMNDHYCLDEIILYWKSEENLRYKKYLTQELDSILTIMRQKGTHPQDLIKKTIREAKKHTEHTKR